MSTDLRIELQMVAGALQAAAQIIPRREQHVVRFTGEWEHFGLLSIRDILDRVDRALDSPHGG